MERIEWVIKGEVFWNNQGLKNTRPATLCRINKDSAFNTRLAYVNQYHMGVYEAILLREKWDTWTLGEFDNVCDAKNAILAALTIERMEH